MKTINDIKLNGIENNTIYNCDCLDMMSYIKDNSIDIIVSSPPYYNLKSYSNWNCYNDYLGFIKIVSKELFRIIKPGRHVFWNIQHAIPTKTDNNSSRNMYPLSSNTELIFMESGFNFEGQIVWDKGIGGATQKMFGSFPKPPTMIPSFRTEDILLFRKDGKPDNSNYTDKDKISKDDWVNIATNLWKFNAETRSKHPAPFPEHLVVNCLKLWSFTNDLVFDPFMGSYTTASVAIKMGRQYIGCEQNIDYCKIGENRINTELNQCKLNFEQEKMNI